MASMMELYQIAQSMGEANNRNPLADTLNLGLKSFQGGMEKAKADDEKQLERAMKLMEFQKKVQEYKDYQSRMEQMESIQRNQSLDTISNNAPKDRSNAGKLMEMINDKTPMGKRIKTMFESTESYRPAPMNPDYEYSAEWGDSGPKISFKEKDPEAQRAKRASAQSEKDTKWVNEQKKRIIDEMKQIEDDIRYGVGDPGKSNNSMLIRQQQLADLNKWIPGDQLPRVEDYEVEEAVTDKGFFGIGKKTDKVLRKKGEHPNAVAGNAPPFKGQFVGQVARKGNVSYTWDGKKWN